MRVPLIQGDYTTRSVIADAQRCVNLYGEANPKDSLCPFTFYNCPGLTPLGTPMLSGPGRGLYWANNNALYGVVGNTLYAISPAWAFTALGTIGTTTGIVSMSDNGTTMSLVDGSSSGYQVDLTTNAFSQIDEANNSPTPGSEGVFAFYGANRTDVVDGFMLFNQPGTRNFYCTQDNNLIFDSLNFAAKNGYSDNLVTIIVTRREIWLLGERTTEIWYDAGGALFPFQIMPGPFVQHGCSAVNSVAQINGAIYWLGQDQAGNNLALRGEGYLAKEISNPAIVAEWSNYSTTADAEGFCFQQGAHHFYQINFPAANKSWRWDSSTGLWHQPVWTDANGKENRHRAACVAYAYGINVALDWQTGQLYQIDPNNHTDAGMPMYFRRGFPHMMNDGARVTYPGFVLDVEAATSLDTIDQPGPFPLLSSGSAYGTPGILTSDTGFGLLSGPAPINTSPQVLLRWSDDRGRTWGNPVPQSLGATGQYLSQPQWSRTGMARDRVFEVFGVIPGRLAINGAFLDPPPIRFAS